MEGIMKPKTPQECMVFYTRRPWDGWQAPFEIAPGLYYVSGNDWVSSFLLDSGDGLILIDAPLQESLYLLTESIRQLGFNPLDIRMILLSHAHIDHCGGVKAMAEYTGAPIWMSREEWKFISEHPELMYKGDYCCGDFEPDAFYDDTPIKLGKLSIQTKLTPGHTPGTTSFFFTVGGEGNEYHCGFHGGVGLNTLTDEFYKETGMPSSLRDKFISDLKEMEKMDIDITIPSHPKQIPFLELVKDISPEHNPFIDQSRWGDMLRLRREMTEKLCASQI